MIEVGVIVMRMPLSLLLKVKEHESAVEPKINTPCPFRISDISLSVRVSCKTFGLIIIGLLGFDGVWVDADTTRIILVLSEK